MKIEEAIEATRSFLLELRLRVVGVSAIAHVPPTSDLCSEVRAFDVARDISAVVAVGRSVLRALPRPELLVVFGQ
jgi:hypothetical protein